MAYGVLRAPVGVISEYERQMRSAPPVRLPLATKLARLPDILFGPYPDRTGWVLLGLLAATAVGGDRASATDAPYRARGSSTASSAAVSRPWRGGWRSST